MLVRFATYGDWVRAVEDFLTAQRLPAADRDAIFAGNALARAIRACACRVAAFAPSRHRHRISPTTEKLHETIADQRRHRHRARSAREHGVRLPAIRLLVARRLAQRRARDTPRHAQRARLGRHRLRPGRLRPGRHHDVRRAQRQRRAARGRHAVRREDLRAASRASGCPITSTGTRPRTSSATTAAR